jgi:hypothetical protein
VIALRVAGLVKAHLTTVFAAHAVSRWIEDTTGSSIRKFVRTARPTAPLRSRPDPHVITTAVPLPATSAKPSPRSTTSARVRTSLIKVGYGQQVIPTSQGSAS